MPQFEVAIYNEEVRKLVQEGERHKIYSDDWADIHYFEISADSEGEARSKMQSKYPSSRGFVIDSVGLAINSIYD